MYEVYQRYRNLVNTKVVIRLLGGDRNAIEKKAQEQ